MAIKTFSHDVKDEICEVRFKQEEAVAELAAMILFGENVSNSIISLRTDNQNIASRIQLVLRKGIDEERAIDILKGRKNYCVSFPSELSEKAGVYFYEDGEIAFDEDVCETDDEKRAFLRGAFIMSGTISDPKKGYSCELVTFNENMSYLAADILENFGIKANTVKRNNSFTTYIKDKSSISDFLNIIGAHKAMLEFLVTQIEKDRNNKDNRTQNCITANVDKTIAASTQQSRAIVKIKDTPKWDSLDETTKLIAQLRLDNFDMSLSEIGERMTPPMTKSSVNRRMKKLIDLAEEK